ncbi:peptidase domain-containing ABC transporter [Zavarzinia sp. CC-PAN008]|uniref:peptidase domain-containing ABC transporter n=1 Tax=Zavarzinia sp. CC-PAN008 TaxID=3243332 RepID=UPI003F74A7B7
MTDQPIFTLTPLHTAVRSLFVVAMHRGVQLKPEHLVEVAEKDTAGSIVKVLAKVGLRGRVLAKRKWADLTGLSSAYPLLAERRDGSWVVVMNTGDGPDGAVATLLDPRAEQHGLQAIPMAQFVAEWTGTLVLCKRASRATEVEGTFGLRWFVPEILRHKGMLRDVAIAATMSNIILFATPLLFQILIDKVITHRSYQTLTAVVLIFAMLTVFDSLFSYTRQYLMLLVTSKVDARLASRIFQKLLSLPLHFFEATTAGVLTRHLQQTETIRHFLTGRLFQTFLDATALPLMLLMLVLYSPSLTLLVLLFSSAIAAVIGFMVPTFRRRLEGLYAAEGARQGHLVETIHGMRTVKSLALEPSRAAAWDDKVATGVRERARVGRIAAIANVVTTLLDKGMQITVLSVGAIQVFDGTLSIGALIAFNMVATRVTGPLVQMVGLINEYQETALAVRMLGIIMQHPAERDPAQAGMMPPITGRMSFEGVTFRYPNAATPALDRLTFDIQPGQVIGIVGRSGSGKTTLTRLIQGIQTAQEGMVRLDGVDLRHIDLTHLRKSIGVVLQENFLFRGTLRENIAAARPEATLAEIVEAARMAGADEFIDRLPQSYETFVEENGANFSGGQRQRIAIARALLVRPRLLIFDEATSALDPESEGIIQDHLAEIAHGRTLVIVSHRLTSLVDSDAILVLEQGKVLDFAPHKDLLERCGVYQRLWQQQTRAVG